jgi:hypothetical protein
MVNISETAIPARANTRPGRNARTGLVLLGAAALLAGCAAASSTKSGTGGETPSAAAPTGDKVTASAPTYATPGKAVLLPGSQHKEIQQIGNTPTFTDYEHAFGAGPPPGRKLMWIAWRPVRMRRRQARTASGTT